MSSKKFKNPLVWGVVAVVVLVAAGLGAWGYASYRERSLHQAVAPQVQAADARLREALAAPLEPAAEQAEQAAAKLEAAAQDIEARLEALRRLDAAPDPARVAMAKEELGNAAEIVRKEAVVVREGIAFNTARDALAQHMRGASSRSGPWVSKAIELKRQLDKAYFNYRFALDGFAARLVDVPDEKLAGQVRARVDAALEHAKAALARSGRLG